MSDENSSDISVTIIKETELAFLFRNNKTADESWFPKEQVYFKIKSATTTIANIPDWLLDKKEW